MLETFNSYNIDNRFNNFSIFNRSKVSNSAGGKFLSHNFQILPILSKTSCLEIE